MPKGQGKSRGKLAARPRASGGAPAPAHALALLGFVAVACLAAMAGGRAAGRAALGERTSSAEARGSATETTESAGGSGVGR